MKMAKIIRFVVYGGAWDYSGKIEQIPVSIDKPFSVVSTLLKI